MIIDSVQKRIGLKLITIYLPQFKGKKAELLRGLLFGQTRPVDESMNYSSYLVSTNLDWITFESKYTLEPSIGTQTDH